MSDRETEPSDYLAKFFDDLVEDHPARQAYDQSLKDKEELMKALGNMLQLARPCPEKYEGFVGSAYALFTRLQTKDPDQ